MRTFGFTGRIRAVTQALSVLTGMVTGCAPSAGLVHIVPTDVQRVALNRPLLDTLPVQQAYCWVDSDGDVCIALHGSERVPGLSGERHFDVALVLGPIPAGVGRVYRAGFHTARARISHGLVHRRYVSLDGLVSIEGFGGRALRGRFRFKAMEQSFLVLTGWGHDRQVLCLGEFVAIPDRAAGEEILARADKGGLPRPPPPDRPVPVEGPAPPS